MPHPLKFNILKMLRGGKEPKLEKKSEKAADDTIIYMFDQPRREEGGPSGAEVLTPYEPPIAPMSDKEKEAKMLPWDQVMIKRDNWAIKSEKSPHMPVLSKVCQNCNTATVVKSVRLTELPAEDEEDTIVRPSQRVSQIVNLNCSFDDEIVDKSCNV